MKTLKKHGIEGRIVFLRNKGLTWREIAEKTGFQSASGPLLIYKKLMTNLKKKTEQLEKPNKLLYAGQGKPLVEYLEDLVSFLVKKEIRKANPKKKRKTKYWLKPCPVCGQKTWKHPDLKICCISYAELFENDN